MVESVTKTKIDRGVAEAIAGRALPEHRLADVSECTDGWFNAVYTLRFVDHDPVILKIAPPPAVRVMRYEKDIITTEVRTMRLLGERTELPVPRIIHWDPSCDIISSPYFLMTACSGVSLQGQRANLEPHEAAAIDAQIAGVIATINSISGDYFGRPHENAPRSSTWVDAFHLLIEDLMADANDASVVLPETPSHMANLIHRLTDELLSTVTQPRLVHWDLWDTNVFIDPVHIEVTGIIDFERALWADPLMEAQFVGKRESGVLAARYGVDLLGDEAAANRRRIYDLYLYLVMIVESGFRNYDNDHIETIGRTMLDSVLLELKNVGLI